MNRIEQPPAMTEGNGAPVDDIDRVLRRYFQAEMPSPWPAPVRRTLPFPKEQRPARSWLSRITLAASVAALLAGSAWFASRPSPAKPVSTAPQEAKNRHELHNLPSGDPLHSQRSTPARSAR